MPKRGWNIENKYIETVFIIFFWGPYVQRPFEILFDVILAPFPETVWTRKRAEATKKRPKDPLKGDSQKKQFKGHPLLWKRIPKWEGVFMEASPAFPPFPPVVAEPTGKCRRSPWRLSRKRCGHATYDMIKPNKQKGQTGQGKKTCFALPCRLSAYLKCLSLFCLVLSCLV